MGIAYPLDPGPHDRSAPGNEGLVSVPYAHFSHSNACALPSEEAWTI